MVFIKPGLDLMLQINWEFTVLILGYIIQQFKLLFLDLENHHLSVGYFEIS